MMLAAMIFTKIEQSRLNEGLTYELIFEDFKIH